MLYEVHDYVDYGGEVKHISRHVITILGFDWLIVEADWTIDVTG